MKKVLIPLLLLIPFAGLGQEYSLEQYLQRVEQQNPGIRMAESDTKQSEEDIRMARSEYLPRVGVTAGYRRDFNTSNMFINGGEAGMEGLPSKFPVNFKNSLNAAATLEQSLYNAPALANLKIAKLANVYMRLQQADRVNEAVQQGALLFYQALYAREALAVFRENSALAENQYRQVSELYSEGQVSEFEVKQSELYYQQTLPDIENAQKTSGTLLRELRVLAAVTEDEPFEIKGAISLPADTSQAISAAAFPDGTLKMRQGAQRVELAKQEISLSRAAYLPKVTLGLNYTLDAYDDKFRFRDKNHLGNGLVNLSIPIFAGGFNRAKVRKSHLAYQKSQLEYAELGDQLTKRYRDLLSEKNTASVQIATTTKMVELADKEIEASQEKLKLGLITNLELREARISYVQAKLQLLNAALDYQAADIQIKNLLK